MMTLLRGSIRLDLLAASSWQSSPACRDVVLPRLRVEDISAQTKGVRNQQKPVHQHDDSLCTSL